MSGILGNFIVFEGMDGSGTTTQIARLCDFLAKRNRTFFKTAEPSDNIIGRFIRERVLKDSMLSLDREGILHLYVADRFEHVYGGNGVIANLKRNDFVVQDRYFFSSLAYQSVDVPYDKVFELNKSFPYPEFVFYLECPVDICMERISARGLEKEIFEKEDFLRKVSANYDKCFERLPDGVRFCRIDSSKSRDEVFDEIIRAIGDRI